MVNFFRLFTDHREENDEAVGINQHSAVMWNRKPQQKKKMKSHILFHSKFMSIQQGWLETIDIGGG